MTYLTIYLVGLAIVMFLHGLLQENDDGTLTTSFAVVGAALLWPVLVPALLGAMVRWIFSEKK